MFIPALSTIAKLWKEPKCPSTDEWIKKWHVCVYIYIYTYTHIYEYYSTIKRNEILPFAKIWMELEYIMLSEISQSEKDKYHMISLICGNLRNKIDEHRGKGKKEGSKSLETLFKKNILFIYS